MIVINAHLMLDCPMDNCMVLYDDCKKCPMHKFSYSGFGVHTIECDFDTVKP
jgi:hypothetical protein